MEVFLAEYGLSTEEGVALMCLAEALLRVPDADTIDALIEDKIAPSQWSQHLGKSSSSLVNASTWALMLTGKVLDDDEGTANILRKAIKRLGEPVIRVAVKQAMKELGGQFVLGETIGEALERGRRKAAAGYTFSYDMLGEAALTAADASKFFTAYETAIRRLTAECKSDDIRLNPGISIKLSALHPRYEQGQRDRVMTELVPRTLQLAKLARDAGMGLNIDAEEADRLELSLEVIEAVLRDPTLAGWDGFGVVVQAYGKRAMSVINWLYDLARELDRKIMVRLVKGAYWDTEIKRAQVQGLDDFPVFTRKAATDVSFLCCAQRLLALRDRIYPQFATHNAHSVATILEMADDPSSFEFQRLHGMGEALHDMIIATNQARSRIYAPVGAHRDLLAYLVRRLLENGANSSFVNQIVNTSVPAEQVARDPFEELESARKVVTSPADLFAPERLNSKGIDLHDPRAIAAFDSTRAPYRQHEWYGAPILSFEPQTGAVHDVINPADPTDIVGKVSFCHDQDVTRAIDQAVPWDAAMSQRVAVLNRASDLYEANAGEIYALLIREAGKTPADAVAELREAIDFLRYYAARGAELTAPPRGVFSCISPWNFPLAIFTGQIAAALVAGNGVLAKPAEQTTLIACLAVRLLHEAGVPRSVLQLLPGTGATVGAAITGSDKINGVCFTGSTATAQTINRAMAAHMEPSAPLIAETGGLNAMVVDSTALPEQAVKDVIASAFQSAGQRCSALRMLYVQQDIADNFLNMLFGAMDELVVGDPWHLSTDLGPIINPEAQHGILAYIDEARRAGTLIKEIASPDQGCFVPPTVIKLNSISELEKEVFGPVLHVATFKAEQLAQVVADINATGYGLTFGMHTRIDDRVQLLSSQIKAGNIYVNRNQIGAIVGSQPFGGEGLSGTGPKAGGPHYVKRFTRSKRFEHTAVEGDTVPFEAVQAALDQAAPSPRILSSCSLPGPTGESNRLMEYGRGTVLCLGPGKQAALDQAEIARANGCGAVAIAPGLRQENGLNGVIPADYLYSLNGLSVVAYDGDQALLRAYRVALAQRDGALIGLCAEADLAARCRLERHVCIDTTAAGGNAALLAEAS